MSEENTEATERTASLMACDRLRHFINPDGRQSLKKVCIKDGCAYVSDGRVAIKWQLSNHGGVEDDMPDTFPLDSIENIIKDVESADSWSRIDKTYYRAAEKPFLEEYNEARAKSAREDRDRYTKMSCPCCCEDLYYDSWAVKLVKEDERELTSPLKPIDKQFPVVLVFGESHEKKILINFGYLLTIVMALGDDLVFCKEERSDKGMSKLLFRSEDGSIKGVLCPLRTGGNEEDFRGIHEIIMVRT